MDNMYFWGLGLLIGNLVSICVFRLFCWLIFGVIGIRCCYFGYSGIVSFGVDD